MKRWLIVAVAALPALVGGLSSSAESATDESAWTIPSNKEDFHVFLLMGQSNMAGGIKGEHLTEEDKTPVPYVIYIPTLAEKRFTWRPAAHPLHTRRNRPKSFGLGLPFAKQYLASNPGVTVGLIPVAFGGHCIEKLNKGTKVYSNAVSKAAFASQQGVIKGILWHQGESDASTRNPDRPANYEKRLHQLIADCRAELGAPTLPFIVGDLAPLYGVGEDPNPDPARVAAIDTIRTVLKTLPDKVERTAWVSSEGLTCCDAPKHTHFDKASYIELGQRYAESYRGLTVQ